MEGGVDEGVRCKGEGCVKCGRWMIGRWMRGRWVIGCLFLCENGNKKETSWDKVERHKV